MGTKAEQRAARERVSAYHQAQLGELLINVTAAIDHYRAGEIDAYTVDETIHHYHRTAGELWKFCFSGGGGGCVLPAPKPSGRARIIGVARPAMWPLGCSGRSERPSGRKSCSSEWNPRVL